MKPMYMKRIDGFFGGFFVFIFSPLAVLVDCIIKIKNKFKSQIVIFKLLGGGSLLISYPALLGLKKQYQNYKFILVCTREVAIYAQLLHVFDEIIIINTSSIFHFIASVLYSLKRIIFSESFLNFELHSKLCTFYSILSLSKNRIGLYMAWNKWQKYYINLPIFYNPHSPIYTGYEHMVESIDSKSINWNDASKTFRKLHSYNGSNKSEQNSFLLAPFCSNLYKERQFTSDEWIFILKKYIPKNCNQIILVGSLNDISCAMVLEEKIIANFQGITLVNKVGKTTLNELISLFGEIDTLITIDSGINHLARLLKVKIISFWGPSNPNLRLKNINNLFEIHHYNKISCSPCVHQIDVPPCNGNNKCMQLHLSNEVPQSLFWRVN